MKRLIAIVCLLAGLSQAATSYTLTNGGATAWENVLNWTPNGNPGAASGDSAIMTNAAMIGTNTISVTPANVLSAVSLSNSTGFLVLDITNCLLMTSTLNLYNNSHIQIDNGGVLSNAAPGILGSNVTVTINSGGFWGVPTTGPTLATPNSSLTVLGSGVWSNPANFFVGSANGNTNITVNLSGVVITNAGGCFIGGTVTGTKNLSCTASNGLTWFGGGGGHTKVGYGSNNVLNIGGLGSAVKWITANLVAGSLSGDCGNTINITNATVLINTLSVGFTTYDTNNTINIYSGSMVSNVTGSFYVGNGAGANYNTLNVFAGATVNVGGQGLSVGSASGATGNVLNINGGVVTNVTTLLVGHSGSGPNTVVVNNGTLGFTSLSAIGQTIDNQSFYATNSSLFGGITVGNNATATNNVMQLVGCNWNMGGSLYVGQGNSPGCDYNRFNASASIITSFTRIWVGASSANNYNSAIFSNGCYLQGLAGSQLQSGYGGTCTGNVLQLGGYGAMSVVSNASTLISGNYAGCYSNSITITNCAVYNAGLVTVGITTGTNNIIAVQSGGLLEAQAGLTANANGNIITNNGGTYQFTSATPTITPNGFGNIAINNGTIAFHNCGSVDVGCTKAAGNLSGTTKISYTGTNGFYLNAATNLATGQTYTFSPAYGATNWASLTLANGAVWRGGDVTIGSGGALSGGGTIQNNLTLQSGATLYATTNGTYITVASNLTLSGTLSLPSGYAIPAQGMIIFSNQIGSISGNFSSVPIGSSITKTSNTVILKPSSGLSAAQIMLLGL